mmetsp:Transcript_30085/g.45966  ORF Transcript_30085/g.45966 Transcript_30085/m.45966 type:complete len:117 (-) Transcript_30085:72-422(-)
MGHVDKTSRKHTSKTVRKENYKNKEALGPKKYARMQTTGHKSALKNKNWHHKIGGAKEKYAHDDIYAELHEDIDEQLYEVEEEQRNFKEANDPNFYVDKMSKGEKDSLKFAKQMLA